VRNACWKDFGSTQVTKMVGSLGCEHKDICSQTLEDRKCCECEEVFGGNKKLIVHGWTWIH
jgi:hypothetical protein